MDLADEAVLDRLGTAGTACPARVVAVFCPVGATTTTASTGQSKKQVKARTEQADRVTLEQLKRRRMQEMPGTDKSVLSFSNGIDCVPVPPKKLRNIRAMCPELKEPEE